MSITNNALLRGGFYCLYAIFFLLTIPFHSLAEENSNRYGTQTMPEEGMSVNELMKTYYHIKFTKDCKNYESWGGFTLIDKRGLKLNRKWHRYRIIVDRLSDGMDYKDLLVVDKPQHVKGLAVLSWTYMDPDKDQDVWLWLPSLRKIRRISQADDDDAFWGTDWTYEEVVSRQWASETYQLIGEEDFAGYRSSYTQQDYNQGVPCYLVEAKPKQKDWYYIKRHIYLDKKTACNVFEELYDSKGLKFKTISRDWSTFRDAPYITEDYNEAKDLRQEHLTTVDIEDVIFDQKLKEGFFSEKTLMRTKW